VPRYLAVVMMMMVVVTMVQRFSVRADRDDREKKRNDQPFQIVHGDTFSIS